VAVRIFVRQLESIRRILKALMMTTEVISIAFVSLQRIPCVVMKASLLIRAACGRPASMKAIQFLNRWISSPVEALISAAAPR
jgi:hypothetical protein